MVEADGLDSGIHPDGYIDNVTFILDSDFGGVNYSSCGRLANIRKYIDWDNEFFRTKINNLYVDNFILTYRNIVLDDSLSTTVLAHEFGHALGFKEMYKKDGYAHPTGPWNIMSQAFEGHSGNPPSFSAYQKYKYTKWMGNNGINDIPIISGNGTYTLNSLTTASLADTMAYRYYTPSPDSTEYFSSNIGVNLLLLHLIHLR